MLGVPLTLPVLHASGKDITCRFLVEQPPFADGGRSVYLTWIEPCDDSADECVGDPRQISQRARLQAAAAPRRTVGVRTRPRTGSITTSVALERLVTKEQRSPPQRFPEKVSTVRRFRRSSAKPAAGGPLR